MSVLIQLPSKEELELLFEYRSDGFLYKNNKKSGCVDKSGRYTVKINKKNVQGPRVIWKLLTGEEPIEIDHINHMNINLHNKENPYDNRIENLRNVTKSENSRNQALRSEDHHISNTGKKSIPYEVMFKINYKRTRKSFKTKEEAIIWRDQFMIDNNYPLV